MSTGTINQKPTSSVWIAMNNPLKVCQVHKHRDEVPLDRHHIWPQADGGPTLPDNLVWVCPNGHREIHEYLRLLKKLDGKVPWLKRRKYGKKVRDLAETGYVRFIDAGGS
jgi:hypothetical protein